MADLTTQELDAENATPTLASASSGGDTYENRRHAMLLVKNDDSAAKTVTLTSQVETAPGVSPADHDVTVPAGGVAVISLQGNGRFGDVDGRVQVSYSATTSVEVAAVSL
jgi:hypothetical protein